MPPRLLAVFSLLMTACSARIPVTIDLHTDLVPLEEFDSVRIRVGDDAQNLPVGATDSFLPTARRLGDFRVASSAAVPVEVSLVRGGSTVLSRRVVLAVRQQLVVPVWLLRSCISVSCPDGTDPLATECDDGRCVRPECEGDGCMIGGCTASTECMAPPAACAEARCLEGRCAVVARAGACDADSYCVPERGCEARSSSPADAGVPDVCGVLESCGPDCRVPVLRFYRASTQSYLFTTNAMEACCGFDIEGTAFSLYDRNVGGGLVPLNRCHIPTSDVHVYGTMGCDGAPGAVLEGPVGYMLPTDAAVCGATALFRLTRGDRELLSRDAAEVANAVSDGWFFRDVIGQVWTN